MKIKENIILELSEDDISEIIKDYYKDKYNIYDISFKLGDQCIGYGMHETYYKYFKGVNISAIEKED